ncbi:hypothetical protein BSKO_01944 [Bryopsis sp. KO-2023]|nr:hypothetical protein BSKO_01944 [Bryopsis sp. KO-2023]
MRGTTLSCAILVLLCGHAVAEFSEVTFGGRKLSQRRRVPSRSSRGPTQQRPSPVGGSPDDWEVVRQGAVKGIVVNVFNVIEEPKDAVVFAFEDLIFSSSTEGSDTTLTLNSGEQMVIEHVDTGISRPGLFHLFRIKSHTEGILRADGQNINIAGSQFFIQLTGISTTDVEVGWLSSVEPASARASIGDFFGGIVEEMVDRFKAVFIGADCVKVGPESVIRDITGVCNNVDNTYGAVNEKLARVTGADFGDGSSTFGGSDISAREISNIVAREVDGGEGSNRMKATDAFVFFGQFIDHDIGISPVGAFASKNQPLFSTSFEKFFDEVPIEIPSDDPDFTGKSELPFERAVFVRKDNQEVFPREIVNQITSYLDLSQVYGSTPSRTSALRADSDGLLLTSGSDFLPFNGNSGGVGIALDNAPDASGRFHVGGDIRANENVNLLAIHTIWLREHNRVARELKSAFGDQFDNDELFEFARAICIAEYQSILYTEWLPVLLGSDSPSASGFSYSSGIDASADAFFTTASFRFGHSMVSSELWRVDAGSTTPSATASLRDLFFNPEALSAGNIDSWCRGMMWHEAREPDEKVIDDLRSFLFTEDGGPSMDLVALNIQRARDMGVPTYSKARESFGLPRISSMSGISDNPETVEHLEEAYEGDVDLVDAFIGGLAENKPAGQMFGPLFHESLKEQFRRLRDGDRYFYKGLQFDLDLENGYPRLKTILGDGVKFMDVLARNSDISGSDLQGRSSVFTL